MSSVFPPFCCGGGLDVLFVCVCVCVCVCLCVSVCVFRVAGWSGNDGGGSRPFFRNVRVGSTGRTDADPRALESQTRDPKEGPINGAACHALVHPRNCGTRPRPVLRPSRRPHPSGRRTGNPRGRHAWRLAGGASQRWRNIAAACWFAPVLALVLQHRPTSALSGAVAVLLSVAIGPGHSRPRVRVRLRGAPPSPAALPERHAGRRSPMGTEPRSNPPVVPPHGALPLFVVSTFAGSVLLVSYSV